jgi:hypothetical protein
MLVYDKQPDGKRRALVAHGALRCFLRAPANSVLPASPLDRPGTGSVGHHRVGAWVGGVHRASPY